MGREVEETNRRLLRARDAMDRAYEQPLDIVALARIACVSEAHFIPTFRDIVGQSQLAMHADRYGAHARCLAVQSRS